MQVAYDLWETRQNGKPPRVEPARLKAACGVLDAVEDAATGEDRHRVQF